MANRNPNPPPPPDNENRGPRRATLERMEIAERAIVEHKSKDRQLAKDDLYEAMKHFKGVVSRHQPDTDTYDESLYWRAGLMWIRAASALAPYQSPTFRAVFFTPEVIGQAEINEQDARERMREIIGSIAPEILDDEERDEEQAEEDEPELIMSNGGGQR